MFPRVIEAHHVRGYTVFVRFQDGIHGEVDLQSQLYGEVFEPLKDPNYFRQFRVDCDLHTLVWPNGADFAPEFLYERAQVTGLTR
jgi:hypothetical protein